MNEDKEKKLISLLTVRRREAFWQRQEKEILAAAGRPDHRKAWLLAPAAAMAALLFFTARPQNPAPLPENPVNTAFLEHLDLLDDMDVLEAVPENEL